MDQKKIGAFIAQCRKEKSLTQIQLAELLDITNQAISKWENGRGMPDVSLLQPLCDALGISLNELFSGEHISAEEYKGKAEENISKLYKEKQIANLKPIKYLFSTCSNVTLLVAVIELAVGFIGNFFNPKLATPISNGGLTFTPPGSTTGSARGGVSQHLYYWSPAKSGLLLSSIL